MGNFSSLGDPQPKIVPPLGVKRIYLLTEGGKPCLAENF